MIQARPRKSPDCDGEQEALGVQDCESMTVLLGRGDAFDLASTYCPVTDEPTGQAVLTRALMSSDGSAGDALIARLVWRRPSTQSPVPDVALGTLAEFSR